MEIMCQLNISMFISFYGKSVLLFLCFRFRFLHLSLINLVQYLQAINLKLRYLPHALLEHLPELKHVNLPPKHPLPNVSHEPNANRLNVKQRAAARFEHPVVPLLLADEKQRGLCPEVELRAEHRRHVDGSEGEGERGSFRFRCRCRSGRRRPHFAGVAEPVPKGWGGRESVVEEAQGEEAAGTKISQRVRELEADHVDPERVGDRQGGRGRRMRRGLRRGMRRGLRRGMLRNPDSIDEILVGNGEPLPAFAFALVNLLPVRQVLNSELAGRAGIRSGEAQIGVDLLEEELPVEEELVGAGFRWEGVARARRGEEGGEEAGDWI